MFLLALVRIAALEPEANAPAAAGTVAAEPAKADARPPARQATEYETKAAYLLTMSRYVEWPQELFALPTDPVVIGVLGVNPFGPILENFARDAKCQGRPIVIRFVKSPEEAARCQVIFIARKPENSGADWLRELHGRPVLTITESAAGLAEGAMLTFVIEREAEGRKVKFHASVPNALAGGLRLRAQMLEHAALVERASRAN